MFPAPYKRCELEGDLKKLLTNQNFNEKNSVNGQMIHTILRKIKTDGSQRSNKSTKDSTPIEK